jgi:putative transposase
LKQFQESATEYNRLAVENYQVWQPRFDDFAIRTDQQMSAKLNYVHGNPLKHRLVDDVAQYPYTSFHDYAGKKNGYISVECGHSKL